MVIFAVMAVSTVLVWVSKIGLVNIELAKL